MMRAGELQKRIKRLNKKIEVVVIKEGNSQSQFEVFDIVDTHIMSMGRDTPLRPAQTVCAISIKMSE